MQLSTLLSTGVTGLIFLKLPSSQGGRAIGRFPCCQHRDVHGSVRDCQVQRLVVRCWLQCSTRSTNVVFLSRSSSASASSQDRKGVKCVLVLLASSIHHLFTRDQT